MRLVMTKWFRRFVRKERVTHAALREAIARAEQGLVDADLGGHVIKQRVARTGQGRSGGYRVIAVYRAGERAIFMYGFAKSDRDNLSPAEEAAYKAAAKEYLALPESVLDSLIECGALLEIETDD